MAHTCVCVPPRVRVARARDTITTKHAALATTADDKFSSDATEDLSDGTVAMFEEEARVVSEIVETRVGIIVGLVTDCQGLITELAIDALSEFDEKILGSLTADHKTLNTLAATENGVGISGDALQELTVRLGELSAEKRRRKVKLGELGSEIASLWEKVRHKHAYRKRASRERCHAHV